MFTIVYLTINKVNLKMYVGVHDTETPYEFDGYLGCGAFINAPKSYNKGKTPFHSAILKYGVNNFYRLTLCVCDTREEALEIERKIVNEDWIQNPNTYNISIGGGDPPAHNKEVFAFTFDGKLYKSWSSIKDATKELNVNKDRVSSSIRNRKNLFRWFFSYNDCIDISEYHITRNSGINVYNEDGVLLYQFNSAKEASDKLNVDKNAICSACAGKYKLHGLYYLHAQDDVNSILKATKTNPQKREIHQYDLNGNYVATFDSVSKAKAKTKIENIIRAAKTGKTAGGFFWSYIKTDKYVSLKNPELKAIKVSQYDLNGTLIKTYKSVAECKKLFPKCTQVCKGIIEQYKGYVFKYVKDIV